MDHAPLPGPSRPRVSIRRTVSVLSLVALLHDLSSLAHRSGDHDEFAARFLALRTRHERKPSLQERFDKAGLPRHP